MVWEKNKNQVVVIFGTLWKKKKTFPKVGKLSQTTMMVWPHIWWFPWSYQHVMEQKRKSQQSLQHYDWPNQSQKKARVLPPSDEKELRLHLDVHAIHSTLQQFIIKPIKPVRNRPSITDNSSQEQRKMQIKAKTVLEQKPMASTQHNMQKQVMATCEQHMCDSSPGQTQVFLQHATPTPWKPPNGATWHPLNHPKERATNVCGGVGGDFFT